MCRVLVVTSCQNFSYFTYNAKLIGFADFLGKQLEDYVSQLPVPVHIERMGVRSGLIRARLRGNALQHSMP
jgi:hypothetical protein